MLPPQQRLKIAYTLLPPPLSALPAKYHAPISLLLHSLSTGLVADELAKLAEYDDLSEIAFFLGITHDIHQKLVEDGLTTLRTAKRYIREKLDELGKLEYYRYIDDALDNDACGKSNQIRGLPKKLSLICHIGDMTQGRMEGIALLYWLKDQVRNLHPDLTVRYYNITIPQVFARSYMITRIYQKHVADKQIPHLALTSPWGLYIITYEDELPEILEVSWDELRLNTSIIDYSMIKEMERHEELQNIVGIKISKTEIEKGLWSRFARMFYESDLLGGDSPLYPKLSLDARGLFINIEFTDIDFSELKPEETFTCGLCGMPHHKEYSLPISMYGTKQGIKIAGTRVTPEKWNRFLPSHIKVKTWDSKGPWKHGIGMCPLCTLDAVAVRELKIKIIEKKRREWIRHGVISVSISKPIPIELLKIIGQTLRDRSNLEKEYLASTGTLDSVVVDYNVATVATTHNVPEPKTENMFDDGELVSIGRLLSVGLYPLKFLPGLDTSLPDRMLTTRVTFQTLDFSTTSKKSERITPWVAELVKVAGHMKRTVGMEVLMDRPEHAPLHLLTLDKPVYDHVSFLLRKIGVRV